MQQEEEVREEYQVLRGPTRPLPGTRPERLPAAPGPQAAVTVGYVAAEAPSLVIVGVAAHDGLDQATVQFLLQQSLLARAEEEEDAREQAELDQLEEEVTLTKGRLLEAPRRTTPKGSVSLVTPGPRSQGWRGTPWSGLWPWER